MTASAPDESVIQQAFQHFSTPGTANYFKALHDLYQATQKKHNSQARLGFLVSATVNAMTAQLVELYFGEQPDVWERYRAQGDDFNTLAVAFWTDERVVARDAALWENLADKLEVVFDG
jgi:signal transduction protein with GAF and PtsI domain